MLSSVAQETFGFSGAQLESVANEVAILVMREQRQRIQHRHFTDAIDKVIMGEKLECRPANDELWRIAVHEIGHALASELRRSGSVFTITTTPRGKALGYVRQSPERDSYLYTQEYLEGQIAIMLAGAAAEEIVLGNRSTGSANDYQQAVGASKQMIAAGMSSLGVVSLDDVPAGLLHKVIQQIIADQQENVKKELSQRRELLTALAETLLLEEKLTGEYLRCRLLGKAEENIA